MNEMEATVGGGLVTDTETAPGSPPRASRAARTGYVLLGFVWLGLALWLLAQFVGTTWDAGVLLVRGEIVPATVVEVDLHTRLGRADELVVTTGPPYSGRAEITTYREDVPVGAVVEVVVDPHDTSRASLAEDGWPWWATLFPLLLAPITALAAIVSWGRALDESAAEGATDTDADADADAPQQGPTTPEEAGSDERA